MLSEPQILENHSDCIEDVMRYIREHNKDPKPIKWKYDDASRRIRSVQFQ